MRKTCTIILTLILTFTMAFGFTGCSDDKATLVNKTVNGLSLDIPDDFNEFTEKQGIMVTSNNESNASIAISGIYDASELPLEYWNDETYMETALSAYTDANILELDTNASISGYSAVHAHYTVVHPSGAELEAHNYIIYFPEEEGIPLYQTLTLSFNKSADSSLRDNIDAILSSINCE